MRPGDRGNGQILDDVACVTKNAQEGFWLHNSVLSEFRGKHGEAQEMVASGTHSMTLSCWSNTLLAHFEEMTLKLPALWDMLEAV